MLIVYRFFVCLPESRRKNEGMGPKNHQQTKDLDPETLGVSWVVSRILFECCRLVKLGWAAKMVKITLW